MPTVVHTFHGHVLRGYFSPPKEKLFRGLEAFLARAADALVAVSESVKRDLVELRVAPAPKIRVIPLGLELGALAGTLPRGTLRREAGIPDDAPLVGIVGRLVPIKDVPSFLNAARRVRERRPDARFAVVGDGEERAALEQQTTALGLAGAVHFFGWRHDLAAVYGDLDVVVNASRNEGTPVALIEALAAARPVVATAVGGTPDLVGRRRAGPARARRASPRRWRRRSCGTRRVRGLAPARAGWSGARSSPALVRAAAPRHGRALSRAAGIEGRMTLAS